MAEKNGGIFNFFKKLKNKSTQSLEETSEQPQQSSPSVEQNPTIQTNTDSQETIQNPVSKTDTDDAPKEKRKRIFPYTSDPLQALYHNWLTETDSDGVSVDISEYMTKHAYPLKNSEDYNFNVNIKRFFMNVRIAAKKRANELNTALRQAERSETESTYSADAEPIFYMTPDSMMLLVTVLPPIGKGQHIQSSQLNDYIKSTNIRNGVSSNLINHIVTEKSYFTIYPLAIGTLPIPGKDGEVVEHIPREEELSFNEHESGNIDFASFNFIRQISKDDVICDILAPTAGIDGIDILGRTVPARTGKSAYVPMGKNTHMSEEKTKLLASVDGYISFQSGTFRITEVLKITHNVDFSVGNINYHGTVIVFGDVLNGFEIRADEDVIVHGVVEAARITAGRNIVIHKGMNGNYEGELNAKGDIRSPFLENTLISSGGDIHVGSLISCDVFCDGTIFANSKMGIIIGGSLTAMHAIKANVIGNKAGRKTELTLGTLPQAVREKDGLEKSSQSVDETMNLLQKNIAYLKGIENLPDSKLQILKQLEAQYNLYNSQKESLAKQHESLSQQLDLVDEAVIECKTIYPTTAITISGDSIKITQVTRNAKIGLNEDGKVEIFPLEA